MKQIIIGLLVIILTGTLVSLVLCGENSDKNQESPIEIRENLFLLQISDVLCNFDDYEGKTLKVEGMYGTDTYEGMDYHAVFRFGPNCCGNDEFGGFFLNYDGEWPEPYEWIEVLGTPRIIEDRAQSWVCLDVTSLIVKEERGAETVYQ